MANKTILVCDVCGAAATRSVTLLVGARRLSRDYCATHLAELTKGARPARRRRTVPRATVKSKTATARTRRRKRISPAGKADVAAEVTKLRAEGMSYRQVGAALMERGIKPPRAKSWNTVVLGRMVKNQSPA